MLTIRDFGELEMKLFGLKKRNKQSKKDDNFDPKRRVFMKQAGIAAAGAFAATTLGLNQAEKAFAAISGIPGAIQADPDKKLIDVWWDMHHSKYFDHPYSCNNIEMSKRVMRLRDGPSYNGVVKAITPRISHAYQLMAAKLGEGMVSVDDDNYSLGRFTDGLYYFFQDRFKAPNPDYYWASGSFAEGMFLAAMPGQNGLAISKAADFMKKDARGKEIMLREVYEDSFSNVRANPKVTDVNTMEYRMLSFYWNLGFFILAQYNYGNKEIKFIDRFPNQNTIYGKLHSKYKFDTANGKLI